MQTHPPTLQARIGYSELKFQIAYDTTNSDSTFLVSFQIAEQEALETYSEIDSLTIKLVQQKIPITIPSLAVQRGGLSVPIEIDLERSRPLNSITITFTNVNNGPVTLNSTAFVFRPEDYYKIFQVLVANSAYTGQTILLDVAISGPSKDQYILNPNVLTIYVSDVQTEKPVVFNLKLIDEGKYSTKQRIRAEFTQETTAYWGIYSSSYYKTPFKNCNELRRLALLQMKKFYVDDPMQLQFRITSTENFESGVTFENLRGNEQYTISVCSVSQRGLMSEVSSVTFVTKDNQAMLHKFTLQINYPGATARFKREHLAQVICHLQKIFQVKDTK